MWDACKVLWSLLIGLFRSRASLEAEILILRQQIIVLRRTAPKRLSFNGLDRLIFVGLHRLLSPAVWVGMPTIAAMAFKYVIGQPFIYPKNDVDFG